MKHIFMFQHLMGDFDLFLPEPYFGKVSETGAVLREKAADTKRTEM